MKKALNMIQNSFFIFSLFIFNLGHLSGATIFVGPPPASIQTAIDSALSGDTIQLSAGTYIEQIQVISKDLNIVGIGMNSTIIQAPPSTTPLTQFFNVGPNIWPIVMIDNQTAITSQNVNIENLTVDGNTQQDTSTLPPPAAGQYNFSNRFFAIGYHNAGGTIRNVHTTNTRSYIDFGQLAGGGIVNISTTGQRIFNVDNCLIDFYQRNGIVCMGPTLTANVSGCTIDRAYVLTPNTSTATPNGITFGASVIGSIMNNFVENNIATVVGASSTAINVNNAGIDFEISGNTVSNNDISIFAGQCGDNLLVQNNSVNFTTTPGVNLSEGIIVANTVGLTTLSSNSMEVLDYNMELLTTNGTNQPFHLDNNQFIGSQTGLLVTGSIVAGPVVTMDGDSFNGTVGYYIEEREAPNDIWPSTATVSFDGLISGHITIGEYNQLLTKIYDQHNDPALGLVLDYIIPSSPILTNISPNAGPAVGGNIISITGSGFLSSATSVYFGSSPGINVVVVSDTLITVTVPPGSGNVDITVETPFGITPIVLAGQYTYIQSSLAPQPPSSFIGVVKEKRCFRKTKYVLKAKWKASPSEDVVLYRIYSNGRLEEEISANSRLVFVSRLNSKHAGKNFQIVAVNSDNIESVPLQIRIVCN